MKKRLVKRLATNIGEEGRKEGNRHVGLDTSELRIGIFITRLKLLTAAVRSIKRGDAFGAVARPRLLDTRAPVVLTRNEI